MNLTNRHIHHGRWSLEQNRQVDDDANNEDNERKERKSFRRTFILRLILSIVIFISLSLIYLWIVKKMDSIITDEDLIDFGSIKISDNHSNEAHGVLLPVDSLNLDQKWGMNGNFAYATLLCDNSGLPNARVIAYSLKRAKSKYPLLILTLPHATDGLEELISLGATIEKIPMIPVPFRRPNGKRPSFQKRCKYSKIHLWSLTKYSKITYLDSHLLIVAVPHILLFIPDFYL